MMRIRSIPLVGLVAVACALAIAAPAWASSSSVETYGGAGGNTQAEITAGGSDAPSGPSSSGAVSSGALPFTGADLALAFGGGLVLFAGGVAMARLGSRRVGED
jgi:hypothetical protein